MWVMGEWAVGQWIVGVTSFRKMYGYMGLRSIGSDQLDRFRTQRYNHKKNKNMIQDFASSRSVPLGSDKYFHFIKLFKMYSGAFKIKYTFTG